MSASMSEGRQSRRGGAPRSGSESRARRRTREEASSEVHVELEVTVSVRVKCATDGDLPSSHHVRRQPLRAARARWSSEADADESGLAGGAPPGRLEGDEDFISMLAAACGPTETGATSDRTSRRGPKFERWSISGQRNGPALEQQLHSICPDSRNMARSGRGPPSPDVPDQTLRRTPAMMPDRTVNTPPASEMSTRRSSGAARAGRARSAGAGRETMTRREAERQAILAELNGEVQRNSSEDRPRRSTRRGWRGALERAWQRLDDARSSLFHQERVMTVESLQRRLDNALFEERQAEWLRTQRQR
mmetsp:Transcript_92060/g.269373  ORF Transcript_92060/g.269373 Transcript_92060/m.269373 type:complete len:306 (-) Transcript_92060:174-1091(-)